MSPDANLYLDKMELEKYCPKENCELCRVDSFDEFLDRIKKGGLKGGDCPHWPAKRLEAFRQAVTADQVFPSVPSIDTPRPAAPGLMELLETGPASPVLVTGNSEFSQAIMLAVLSLTVSPIKLVSVDTLGHTVDMAMVFKTLTADKIAEALGNAGINVEAGPRIVLPGLAATLAPELSQIVGSEVEVGPICAAELPLYMGDDWKIAAN